MKVRQSNNVIIIGIVIAIVIAVATTVVVGQQAPPYKQIWFDQIIDHFSDQTPFNGTWKQRYLLVDQWYKPPQRPNDPSPPIFFYTGNEGEIFEFYNNTGFVFDIAPQFNALVVFAEHRYYGVSWPFGDAKTSFMPGHINYLQVEQALADYAYLLTELKAKYHDAPVITFGGSYGGMLSAWMRVKYPWIVTGSIAASAPIVWGTEGNHVSERPSYFETTTNDFRAAHPACPDIARSGFNAIYSLAAQGQSGLDAISSEFYLCPNSRLRTKADVDLLILWVVNTFGTLAMADYPYPASFLGVLPGWPVKVACDILVQNANNPLRALALANGLLYGYNGTNSSSQCFDVSQEFVFCADQTGCGTGNSGISWDYQACTEIIYFPNTNNVTDMFPPRKWTLDDLKQYCMKTFGVVPRENWLKIVTGGKHIGKNGGVTRIAFSNGYLDPWHGGGFMQSPGHDLESIHIADGAHHLDLRFSNPLDPPSVVAARLKEVEWIKLWLKESLQN